MAIRDHLNRTPKLRAKIHTVDPAQGIIEVVTSDGSARRLGGFDVSPLFRWPIEGEEWTIYEENGTWILGGRYPLPDDNLDHKDYAPGQAVIQASEIFDNKNNRIISADLQTITAGQTIVWSSSLNHFLPYTIPAGSSGTVGKYTTATHPTGTSFTINATTHGLTGPALIVQLHDLATGDEVLTDINIDQTTSDVTIRFGFSQPANTYRITIVG